MYDSAIDAKWDKIWRDSKAFLFDEKSDKPSYIIDTPPPFTNGALHMGQAFWVCYIDSIARYKRMQGFNVLYPQGWDAHGFPTELAVEQKYGKGLGRDDFYKKCVEESMGNIANMKDEMLRLGASFDSRYEYLTISDDYVSKVQLSVLQMYENKMVYRAVHPVEWCVSCVTTISREQAEERQEDTNLNYLDFKLSGSDKKMSIATTRPELLHACVGVAVNPNDKRFSGLIGKTVTVPIYGNEVMIFGDEAVDMTFGTGAEMVCTFGDKADVSMYYKHKLALVDAIEENGNLKGAGKFTGMKLKEARKKVIEALKEAGALTKQEKIKHTVKIHDRCATPIEFLSSMQWFIKIKDSAQKIKELGGEIQWVPDFALQRLEDWSNFIEWDWAISRNRIFGTPIPFWHCERCGEIVPADKGKLPVDTLKQKPPLNDCPKCHGSLAGETNTLDGWVDSSITPLVICGWPENRKSTVPPASVRIQGTDIIRTWAFYTIFRTWALTKGKPWESIIAHSMILGSDGREMHKSLGNGVYPAELLKKYTADSIRLWVALSGAIGKDKIFSYKDMDFAKNFINKLYNSALFVQKGLSEAGVPKTEPSKDLGIFDIWILNEFNKLVGRVTKSYDSYNLYEAANAIINFYWHDFCDYYIENVKYRIYSKDKSMERSKHAAAFTLNYVLLNSLKLIAPIAPHATEEINSMFSKESLMGQKFPVHKEAPHNMDYVINGVVFQSDIVDIDFADVGALLNNVIGEVRKAKAKEHMALNSEIKGIEVTVPRQYLKALEQSKSELIEICKMKEVKVKEGSDYAVAINI
jgi:valyl-tRNA synthetase